MNSDKAFPGFWQSVLLLIGVFIIQVIVLIPVFVYEFISKVSILHHPATTGYANILSIGIVVFFAWKLMKLPAKQVFPIKGINIAEIGIVLITTLGFSILLSELDNIVRIVLPVPENIAEMFEKLISGSGSMWGSFFALAIVAPLTEETLFRGVILNGYLKRYSPATAIIVSGLMFGLFHLNPWQFFGAAIIGFVFAWWFIKTGNLTLTILGHFFANFIPFFIIAILDIEIGGFTTNYSGQPEFQPLWLDLTGLFLAVSGLLLASRFFRKPAPEEPEYNLAEEEFPDTSNEV